MKVDSNPISELERGAFLVMHQLIERDFTDKKRYPEEKDTKKVKYGDRMFTRPPFLWEAGHSVHPFFNEQTLYEMEKIAFQEFPRIPRALEEDPITQQLFNYMIKSFEEFKATAQVIQDREAFFKASIEEKATARLQERVMKNIDPNDYSYSPKERRFRFFFRKMELFQNLEALWLYISTHPEVIKDTVEHRRACKTLREIQALMYGHSSYSLVLSACDVMGEATRKNGDLTMDHIGAVTVSAYNEYQKNIENEDIKEVLELEEELLVLNVITYAYHDHPEDFGEVLQEWFRQAKDDQYTTRGNQIQAVLAKKGTKKDPTESHLLRREEECKPLHLKRKHWIKKILEMVNKPSEEEREKMNDEHETEWGKRYREPHFIVDILAQRLGEQVLELSAFNLKLKDRLHNLCTLPKEKPSSCYKKIAEGIEMIEIAYRFLFQQEHYSHYKNSNLHQNIIKQCEGLLKQIEKDIRELGAEGILAEEEVNELSGLKAAVDSLDFEQFKKDLNKVNREERRLLAAQMIREIQATNATLRIKAASKKFREEMDDVVGKMKKAKKHDVRA